MPIPAWAASNLGPEFFTQNIENPSHEIHTYNPPFVHHRLFKKDTLGKVIDRIDKIWKKCWMRCGYGN